jgi:PIN domain nuclease of toxin-antitoxin system
MSETKYLADTHTLLWALADGQRLSQPHSTILLSGAAVFFSAASIWGNRHKVSLGSLKAPDHIAAVLPALDLARSTSLKFVPKPQALF